MFNLICFLHAITYILISDSNDTPLRSKTPFETVQDKLLYYSLAEYISKYRHTNEFYTTINIISKYIRRKEADKPSIKEIKLLLVTHITVIFQINIMRLEFFDLAKDFDDELVYHLTIISESTVSEIRLCSLVPFFEYNDSQYILNRSMSFVVQAFMTLIYEMMLLQAKQGDWHWQQYSFFQNFVSELYTEDETNYRFDTQNQAGIINVNFPLSTIFTNEFNGNDMVKELRQNKKNSVCLVSVYTELNVLKILENYVRDTKPEFTLQGTNHREIFKVLLQNSNFKLLRQIRQQVTDENYIAKEVILFLKPGYYDYFFNERDQVCENFNLEAWKSDTYIFDEKISNLKKIVNRFYFIDDGDDIKAVFLLGMAINLLKTKNKLLSICQHNNIIYIGDFLGNVYKLEPPYNSYQIIADFDEPISTLEVYENNVIAGTWKGNLYFDKKSIHVEEGIVTAIKTLKQYLFVTVNTTLYCYKGMEMKYKMDTTYKVNAMTVTNNSILFAFNMPYTGILHFLDDDYENPLFSISESQHQAGITGIECIDNKIYTSSCDKTVICNGEVVYTGDEWVRCMHDDVFGVGKNIIYKGNKIYEHRDWVSCVLKCNDRIFSIGLDGVIMVYTLVNNFEMFDKEFEEYMKE